MGQVLEDIEGLDQLGYAVDEGYVLSSLLAALNPVRVYGLEVAVS